MRRPGRARWAAARSVIGRGSGVLDGVLDLLAGLLEVGLGLVGPAGRLQLLVVGGPADGLLGLALQLLALVVKLVVGRHGGITSTAWLPTDPRPQTGQEMRAGAGQGPSTRRAETR